jgi:glycosyltransferase involved in cell wall biosynthesis
MRIALVAQNSPLAPHTDPHHDVVANRVSSLAQALAELGHRITIYAHRDAKSLPGSAILAPGVTVEHVTAGPPAPLDPDQAQAHLAEFGNYLAQRWRRSRPDIVHAFSWTAGLAALAGARDLGLPVVQTFNSLGAAEQQYRAPHAPSDIRLRLETCIARRADLILASSIQEQADLARLGVRRNAVKVVPCGVDTARFSPDGPAADRSERPRLLAAEPLNAPLGLAPALHALAEIPEAELVITGGPDQAQLSKDRTYREVMRFAKKLNVQDRVIGAGRISPDDLPALLRSADLLMSTALYEPIGMTALRAMACGTPVVATTAGAEQDAIVDMTTGLITPPGRPAHLAWRIRQLLANPLQLEAYGIAAADRAQSRYPWERIGRETLAAYDSLMPDTAVAASNAEPDDAEPAAEPVRPRPREARRVPARARA